MPSRKKNGKKTCSSKQQVVAVCNKRWEKRCHGTGLFYSAIVAVESRRGRSSARRQRTKAATVLVVMMMIPPNQRCRRCHQPLSWSQKSSYCSIWSYKESLGCRSLDESILLVTVLVTWEKQCRHSPFEQHKRGRWQLFLQHGTTEKKVPLGSMLRQHQRSDETRKISDV